MEIKSSEHYQSLINQHTRRGAYEIYIASPNWKRKREQRLELDNWECRGCGSKDNLHIHHKYPKAYADIPDENVNDDLTTLCEHCHKAIHNSIDERKYSGRDIEVQNYQEPREAQKELVSYGVEQNAVQINEYLPPYSAQRRFGESIKSDCKRNEVDFQEEKQDRSRFRGIG